MSPKLHANDGLQIGNSYQKINNIICSNGVFLGPCNQVATQASLGCSLVARLQPGAQFNNHLALFECI